MAGKRSTTWRRRAHDRVAPRPPGDDARRPDASGAPGSPVRVDAVTGTTERAGYFGPSGARRAAVTYVPRDPNGAGVVICSSITTEFLRTYGTEVDLARRLAARGVTVVRFHYRGAGNSDGDDLDVTVGSMSDDARLAADSLVADGGVTRVAFVGTRFGALPATAAAADRPGAALALVEPVVEAKRFFRDALRARKMHLTVEASAGGDDTRSTDEVLAQIESVGWMEIMGHRIGRAFYESAHARTLVDLLAADARRMLLVQLGPSSDPRPEYARLADGCTAAGWDVETTCIPSREAWFFLRDERYVGDSYVEAVLTWLVLALATEEAS